MDYASNYIFNCVICEHPNTLPPAGLPERIKKKVDKHR